MEKTIYLCDFCGNAAPLDHVQDSYVLYLVDYEKDINRPADLCRVCNNKHQS